MEMTAIQLMYAKLNEEVLIKVLSDRLSRATSPRKIQRYRYRISMAHSRLLALTLAYDP